MKRSEVVDFLTTMIKTRHENISNEQFANAILNNLEAFGMKPPRTEWLAKHRPNQMTFEEVHDYHFWDPESATR